ncbi:hypothetical protein PoB_003729000 [Plakobranchus ocellatus]|uniref:Uncharacterized protein n=1 Tax=Plakobranchus ocellatus TaxID=259542 RepID=A0AAV4AV67_9GAST|nr:hypothetical protein PoB_003729000 [Plakobranchus ocellatus]
MFLKLNPIHDSNLKFCDTICFAEPTAYVSAISEDDGGEIGSLVATPPLASESGTVVIDPSLSASQVQDVKELLLEFQDILTLPLDVPTHSVMRLDSLRMMLYRLNPIHCLLLLEIL